jgi:hypothetical protein
MISKKIKFGLVLLTALIGVLLPCIASAYIPPPFDVNYKYVSSIATSGGGLQAGDGIIGTKRRNDGIDTAFLPIALPIPAGYEYVYDPYSGRMFQVTVFDWLFQGWVKFSFPRVKAVKLYLDFYSTDPYNTWVFIKYVGYSEIELSILHGYNSISLDYTKTFDYVRIFISVIADHNNPGEPYQRGIITDYAKIMYYD